MPFLHTLLAVVGYIGLSMAAACSTLMVVAQIAWRLRGKAGNSAVLPAVSVLKPLCGAEPGLYGYLRSFCQQNYPRFQIVFGLRDPADPAHAVAQRIVADFPHLPITISINPQLHGSNYKVSNLINMLPHAEHEVIVIADSDALVAPDYLAAVTAPFAEESVGLVTCLDRSTPTSDLWSRIGAMYINEWYAPSVLLAWLFGHQSYVSGQTMCLMTRTLQRLGGFTALANHLADDYRLGELVRGLGLRIVLSPYPVSTADHEPSLDLVTRHELRWMRTLRVLRPKSFCWIFPTFGVPLAAISFAAACAATPRPSYAGALFATAVVARLAMYFLHRIRGTQPLLLDLWLVPFRDVLLCWVWFRSFFGSRVTWRGQTFDVDPDGVMHRSV